MNKLFKKWFYLFSFIFPLLCGCSLIPEYQRPPSPVSAEWPTGKAYEGTENGDTQWKAEKLPWKNFFTDASLQEIIGLALQNNRDLRLAALNMERARALYGIQRAELLPSVQGVGVVSKQRLPADLSSTGSPMIAEQDSVTVGFIGWEIDFFGRIRSLATRAREEYLATDEARRSAQILLISSVGTVYLTLAADRENLKLAVSTLETQEGNYKIIRKRFEVGIANELDLKRAQSQVDTARGDVARYTQLEALDINALDLLAGTVVPPRLLPTDLAGVKPLREITPGLSSAVLLERPDVLASEHQLKAANANIGAARAAFFPSIALTTGIGTASADLSGLFKGGSTAWSFIPQISIPIFDPRVWSAYEFTKVEREIALTQYERTIQEAFREVADALAVKGTVNQRIEAQKSLVEAFESAYRLSDKRYMKGIENYLSVLDAQRSLLNAQQGLILLQLLQLNNHVTLYKVLGGGIL
ncbi:MAG TPA: efflux transporter outer membrane subunit [Thermodesulfobacteriota bacterium]|nr:efflux transporter outer membrane subunit [Thermodesulfobacteriota bacterium]